MTSDPRDRHPLPLHGGELVLVRHGESTANAMGIGQGRAEYPLSERGQHQARLTGEFLVGLGTFEAIVSSPQQRAAQTAAAIADHLALPVRYDDDLVEIDIGVLSGRSWDDLRTLHPEVMARFDAAEAVHRHPRNREMIPGWEPVHETVERVWRAMARAASEHPGGRVVVVAHGGVINAFLTHLLAGDAREHPWRHPSPNCAVSRIALTPAGPVASCLTDDAHLAVAASGPSIVDPRADAAP